MSNKKETALVTDPATGEFKEVPKSEAGSITKPRLAASLAPAPEVSPRGLTRALDPDEAGDNTYSTVVSYAGYWFYINEMSRPALKEYAEQEKKWINDTQQAAQKAGDDMDAVTEQGEAITDERQAIDEGIAVAHVVDWTRPKPFTTDALKAMYPSAKAGIAAKIVAKSRISQVEANL